MRTLPDFYIVIVERAGQYTEHKTKYSSSPDFLLLVKFHWMETVYLLSYSLFTVCFMGSCVSEFQVQIL